MRTLHEQSGEWFWGPDPDIPEDPSTVGDEGMDFVVWKETLDNRMGKLFILGQCACGDNWDQKLNDIDFNKINKWFNPLSYVNPVKAFVTPHHLSQGNLNNALRQAGIIFDRIRLVLIAAPITDNDEFLNWIPQFRGLSGLVINIQ